MKKYFTKKRIFIGLIAIIVIAIIVAITRSGGNTEGILTENVKSSNIEQNVLATGQVSSTTDLNLTFKGSGIVDSVDAKVGKKVKEGDILANLSQKDQSATLTQARAGLAQAQANYNKVIAGASGPDIDIAKSAVSAAQTTVNNARATYQATVEQQEILVKNAQTAFYNSGLEAKRAVTVAGEVAVTVSGTYRGTEQGSYQFEVFASTGGYQLKYRGLEVGSGAVVRRGVPMALGTKGLYITFGTTGDLTGNTVWTVDIPNNQASTYLTNSNAYQAALQARDQAVITAQNSLNTAQASLEQANANLAQRQAAARPEDVAVASAQVLAARGQLEAASATLDSTIIRAPSNGTITKVDIKVGEQAGPSKTAIVLQDVDNLHIEANISEANIAQVKVGQEVKLTFDALGPDLEYTAKVQLIDPSSTVVSGVVNYKITVALEKLEEVKPGMTANISILTNSKTNVLNIPQRAVINRDGKKFVRVITDPKKKTFQEQEVQTGLEADGGVVEVISGLNQNQEIVTFINKD